MRTEAEFLAAVVREGMRDERVLAGFLNGSRVDPSVEPDGWRDFDVVFVVNDTAPFAADRAYPARFGAVLYGQYPEDGESEARKKQCYGWLTQYADFRLDLHVETPAFARAHALKDSLTAPLFDKAGVLPPLPPPSDASYRTRPPGQAAFSASCNEFWWCLNNLVKALCRGETVFAMYILDSVLRPELIRQLSWLAAVRLGPVNTGKAGRFLPGLLDADTAAALLKTYPAPDPAAIRQAAITMCELFDRAASETAKAAGLSYDRREAAASRDFFLTRAGVM